MIPIQTRPKFKWPDLNSIGVLILRTEPDLNPKNAQPEFGFWSGWECSSGYGQGDCCMIQLCCIFVCISWTEACYSGIKFNFLKLHVKVSYQWFFLCAAWTYWVGQLWWPWDQMQPQGLLQRHKTLFKVSFGCRKTSKSMKVVQGVLMVVIP